MSEKFNFFMKSILFGIAVLVLGVGMYVSVTDMDHESNVMGSLKFIDEIDGKEMVFTPWKAKKENTYYLVLPSAYKQNIFETKFYCEQKYYSVYIDGKEYQNGEVWTDSLREEVHWLEIEDCFGNICMETPFQVLVSEGLPAVMVTVEAKEELFKKEEFANKQYLEKGNIVVLEKDGEISLDGTMERFKVRGNLTSNIEKKPFTFTLSEAAEICGMAPAVNWNLLANATDGSHIRNKIMLDWASEMSEGYHPDGEYVDLFVNGEYQGLYLLTETVELAENRLELDVQNSMLLEMELDYRAVLEPNHVVTQREHFWVVHQELPMGKSGLQEIADYLDGIESVLYFEEYSDFAKGKKLRELIDYDSWTDSWLLKEVSSDHDLGTTSQFGIVENWESRSLLLAGPEWDFDGTLGNGMVPWSRNPRNLVTAIPNTKGIESVNQNKWLAQMYQHEDFKELLVQKFREEVQPKIRRLLDEEIDSYAEYIRRPALLDGVRWLGNGVCHYFAWPEDYSLGKEKDYKKYDVLDCHVNMVKNFLEKKEGFLQELWIEGAEFEVVIEEHNEEGMSLELNNDIYTWIRKEN